MVGETNREELSRLFQSLGIYLYEFAPSRYASRNWIAYEADDSLVAQDGIVQSSFIFYLDKAVVSLISLGSGSSPFQSSFENLPEFREMWKKFSPDKVVPDLGLPTRVEIKMVYGPGEGSFTSAHLLLYIFYDSIGMLLKYQIISDIQEVYPICPTFGKGGNLIDSIGLTIKPIADPTPIENFEDGYQKNQVISLQNATGLTLSEFHNLFLQSNQSICFNTLFGIFPKP